jgi:hypothetical protein
VVEVTALVVCASFVVVVVAAVNVTILVCYVIIGLVTVDSVPFTTVLFIMVTNELPSIFFISLVTEPVKFKVFFKNLYIS